MNYISGILRACTMLGPQAKKWEREKDERAELNAVQGSRPVSCKPARSRGLACPMFFVFSLPKTTSFRGVFFLFFCFAKKKEKGLFLPLGSQQLVLAGPVLASVGQRLFWAKENFSCSHFLYICVKILHIFFSHSKNFIFHLSTL